MALRASSSFPEDKGWEGKRQKVSQAAEAVAAVAAGEDPGPEIQPHSAGPGRTYSQEHPMSWQPPGGGNFKS